MPRQRRAAFKVRRGGGEGADRVNSAVRARSLPGRQAPHLLSGPFVVVIQALTVVVPVLYPRGLVRVCRWRLVVGRAGRRPRSAAARRRRVLRVVHDQRFALTLEQDVRAALLEENLEPWLPGSHNLEVVVSPNLADHLRAAVRLRVHAHEICNDPPIVVAVHHPTKRRRTRAKPRVRPPPSTKPAIVCTRASVVRLHARALAFPSALPLAKSCRLHQRFY